jgi:hypothetical protein
MMEQILQTQSELAEARARGAAAQVRVLQARLKSLLEDGPDSPINLEKFTQGYDQAIAMEAIVALMARDLKDTREKLENIRSMSRTPFNTVLISEKAMPADKKARPIRWIILVATVLLASLVSVIGAVLVDKITGMMER